MFRFSVAVEYVVVSAFCEFGGDCVVSCCSMDRAALGDEVISTYQVNCLCCLLEVFKFTCDESVVVIALYGEERKLGLTCSFIYMMILGCCVQ